MTEYIHLMGSEDVMRAGHNIQGAADQMSRAAAQFDESITRLGRIIEEFTQAALIIQQSQEKTK